MKKALIYTSVGFVLIYLFIPRFDSPNMFRQIFFPIKRKPNDGNLGPKNPIIIN